MNDLRWPYRITVAVIKMPVLASILAGALLTNPAQAFDVKGLHVGMDIESFRKSLPQLRCKSWLSGLFEQKCDAEELKGRLSTLADQALVSISVLADEKGIAHSMNFSVSCGISTQQMLAAFQRKWGAPNQPLNGDAIYTWLSKTGEQMSLTKANSRDNVCHLVTVMDAAAIQSLAPKAVVPSTDL